MNYKFKLSRAKGKEYLQIWDDDNTCYHIGTAEKVLKLVKPACTKETEKTKLTTLDVLRTNSPEGNEQEKTNFNKDLLV